MHRVRRFFALAVVLTLTFSLLSACKTTGTAVPSAVPEPSASETGAAPVTEAPPPDTDTPPVTEPPALEPGDLYAEAAARFEQTPARTMDFSIVEEGML